MIKSWAVHPIDMTSDELVSALLRLASSEPVCLLDSCGVGHLGSHLLIAGIGPINTIELSGGKAQDTMSELNENLSGDHAAICTISYDLGLKLFDISPERVRDSHDSEPDVHLSQFDSLIIFDYTTGKAGLVGNSNKFPSILRKLKENAGDLDGDQSFPPCEVGSNFTRSEYVAGIDAIKERIRCGDTYQTNLTQQLTAALPVELSPEIIFSRLRRDHPAPFAALIKRMDSTVVSISPERFFRVDEGRSITTSPIKGTRPRGRTDAEDEHLRRELLTSEKDRAENIMIVDLLRHDLGRVCEYGSIEVEKLCELEEHPTLFHLVSTIKGKLRQNISAGEIMRAVFPCGSITGAPKISTMKIIDGLENSQRGLSMGAIGYYVPPTTFGLPETLDLNVAIRTMVIRDHCATFNVGGGIVIDSDAETEYDESLTKARALLNAIGGVLK